MSLTVLRHDGHPELLDALDGAIRELVCRAGEEWTFAFDVQTQGVSLLATGPVRPPCRGWEEQTVAGGHEPRRYRRALGSAPEWGAATLHLMLRDLVWHPLQFAKNPIQRLDAGLARAFERAVLETLCDRPAEPLTVRFGIWDGEEDGPRYVCRLEGVPTAEADHTPAWRWWSPLLRTAAELSSHLQEAVRGRDRRAATTVERQYWGWGGAQQAGA